MGSDLQVPGSVAAAERRYLTILFCDLSDFTGLAEQVEPEVLHQVRDKYQRLALDVIERYGGFVSNFAGDGVLSYFGYPTAHENDAERAVRAALELVRAVHELELQVPHKPQQRLHMRAGLHTGLVLMAPEQSSGGMLEHAVVGHVVNLASRLQHMAEPSTVLLSKETHELVESQVESQPLGLQQIRGLSQPVAVYRILRAREGASRNAARFRRGGTRLIGRSSLLDALCHDWADVQSKQRGRALVVVGEAGMGKTRLAMEFQHLAGLQPEATLQFNCQELFAGTPLYPVAAALWSGARLVPADSEADRTAKLKAFLSRFSLGSAEAVETMRGLLESFGVPLARARPLVPLEIKKRQFQLLTDLLREMANRGPLVLFVEDAHWMDPTSADLMSDLAREVADKPVFFVVTTRPPVGEHLALSIPCATIELAPLSDAECLEVAHSVPGAKILPEETLKQVVTQADGSPLFVEQLTLSIIGNHGRAPPLGARGNDLPLTLAEMVSERLDRIPGGRRIVQMAACLGRSFTRQFIERLLEKQPGELGELLDRLVNAGILRQRETSDSYEFRHALLQRAAHDLMVPQARAAAHGRIVQALQTASQDPVVPEVIAHHLTEAGQFKAAAGAWLQAAAGAARRSAYAEAVRHVERGLGLIDKIDDAEARRSLEISLQASLIGPHTATRGATYEKVLACCQRGLQLCREGPPNPLVFAFLFGQFTHAICRADMALAATSADLFLSAANKAGYDSGKVIGHRLAGMVLAGRGKLAESIESLKTSLDLYVPERDEAATHVFGQNAQVHSRSLLSFALLHGGRVEEALEVGAAALASIDELKHPHSSALALGYVGGWVYGLCGFTDKLMQASRRLVSLAEEHEIDNMRRFGRAFIGWALCQNGDLAQGIAYLKQAVSELESVGFRLTLPTHMSVLADAMRRAGQYEDALALCDRGLQIIKDGGERLCEPEVRRVLATLLAVRSGPLSQPAADMFLSAVDCARQVCSPLLEYRALRSAHDAAPDLLDATLRQRLEELAPLGQLASRAHLAVAAGRRVAAQ
jgi:class 3 adenylate cyclase/tetratricopeptide (TPR) repeat protein